MIKGVTFFHSETGTEGGYWAVQDERFISYDLGGPSGNGAIFIGHNVISKDGKKGKIIDSPSRWTSEDPEYDVTIQWEDGTTSVQKNTETLARHWSYSGLHILKNRNYLKIFKQDGQTIKWEGFIKLIELPLFTEDVFGFWIHADQEGIPREEWANMFLIEHPCEVTNTGKVELRQWH